MRSPKEIIRAILNTKMFAIIGLIMLLITFASLLCSLNNCGFINYNTVTYRIFSVFFILMIVINYIAIILKLIKMKNVCMTIGAFMLMFSVVFFLFAISHPQADLPLSYDTTWVIYRTYIAIMIASLVIGSVIELIKYIKHKRRNGQKEYAK